MGLMRFFDVSYRIDISITSIFDTSIFDKSIHRVSIPVYHIVSIHRKYRLSYRYIKNIDFSISNFLYVVYHTDVLYVAWYRYTDNIDYSDM